jgi:hypothetical protein
MCYTVLWKENKHNKAWIREEGRQWVLVGYSVGASSLAPALGRVCFLLAKALWLGFEL